MSRSSDKGVGKGMLGRGTSMSKRPELGKFLGCLENSSFDLSDIGRSGEQSVRRWGATLWRTMNATGRGKCTDQVKKGWRGDSLEPRRVIKRLCRSSGRGDKGWVWGGGAQDGGWRARVGPEEWITLGRIPFVSQTQAGLARIRRRGCHLEQIYYTGWLIKLYWFHFVCNKKSLCWEKCQIWCVWEEWAINLVSLVQLKTAVLGPELLALYAGPRWGLHWANSLLD